MTAETLYTMSRPNFFEDWKYLSLSLRVLNQSAVFDSPSWKEVRGSQPARDRALSMLAYQLATSQARLDMVKEGSLEMENIFFETSAHSRMVVFLPVPMLKDSP